jgi:hypothetical protein
MFFLLVSYIYSRIQNRSGQEINIGPGKFAKKNKHRALNIHRAYKIWQKEYMQIVRLEKIYSNKGIWPPKNLNFMQELKEIFSNFSSMFLNPNKFFKLDYNQSNLLLQTLGKT